MLVLSRKQDEKIIVGDNITITVLQIRGNTVRLGIDAPREVAVLRGELDKQGRFRKHDDANKQGSLPPVTVVFKTNGGRQNIDSPTLRVMGPEAPLASEGQDASELNDEPDAAKQHGKPLHRLIQMVTDLTVENRSVL